MDVCDEMVSYRQKVGAAKFPVPATPKEVGANDTRIRLSSDQNNPDGELEPPRTGRPCTILPVATLTALASADTQSSKLPEAQLRMSPSLPYTNT